LNRDDATATISDAWELKAALGLGAIPGIIDKARPRLENRKFSLSEEQSK
jgi:hypothetical protein